MDKQIETMLKGARVSWLDNRSTCTPEIENGTIQGEAVNDKTGIEFYEISQGGKYRAIPKDLVQSIDDCNE